MSGTDRKEAEPGVQLSGPGLVLLKEPNEGKENSILEANGERVPPKGRVS